LSSELVANVANYFEIILHALCLYLILLLWRTVSLNAKLSG